jgi:ferredoxin
MEGNEPHFHYVATREEAEELIAASGKFWVSNCGCREERTGCARSRLDLCLFFDPQMGGTGADFREVDADFVAGILDEAASKRLVARPFRYEEDKTRVQGICFCCDDCCYYFRGEEEKGECDKGTFVARACPEACAGCGTCLEVCYFGARELIEGELVVADDRCYGCGLCADVCPEECVTMAVRA